MKNLLPLAVILLITTGIYSCKKSGVSVANSLIGKWNVKKDSLNYGIGPVQQTKTYVGAAGDYFDFRGDNKLYIKEGTQLETFTYKVISANKLQVTQTGTNNTPLNLFIDDFTATSASINLLPTLLNPGGNDNRWVSLGR